MEIKKCVNTTKAVHFRTDYEVSINGEYYYFYVLVIIYTELNTIELWCGEYGYGTIDFMFGIKNDEQGRNLIKRYLNKDCISIKPYFKFYYDKYIDNRK